MRPITFILSFGIAATCIPVCASELKHFQERMPYGLFVPDVDVA